MKTGAYIFTILSVLISFLSVVVAEDKQLVFESKQPHKLLILDEAYAAFEYRLQMIESAKKNINIEYYTFKVDETGKQILNMLIEKAKLGVKVRILVDHLAVSKTITGSYRKILEDNNIEIKYFNPQNYLHLMKIQYRHHRKLISVDGKSALTGGRNIGDNYFDLKKDFNFLDRDIVIEGPIVKSIDQSFEMFWKSKYSKILKSKNSKKKLLKTKTELATQNKKLIADIREAGKKQIENSITGTCSDVQFITEIDGVGSKIRKDRQIYHELEKRISHAKHVDIETPYFLANKTARKMLMKAMIDNGTTIRLLTNGLRSTDMTMIASRADGRLYNWLKRGMEVYIFGADPIKHYDFVKEETKKALFAVHAKTFIFDGKDFMIGTYNFDPRSHNYDTEMMISCNNEPELAQKILDGEFTKRIAQSHLVRNEKELKEVQRKGMTIQKFLGYHFWKAATVMFPHLL